MSPAVQLLGVSKSFPGVTALYQVDLNLRPGSIHALVGENGAGKSTLINILSGLLRPDGGLINTVLGWVGLGGVDWLDNTSTALPTLVVMAAWRNLGTLMVIFLAGLQTVPRDVQEAAAVDGAGAWQRFRHITVPMLRPVLLFGAVITGIGYLQFFEEAFVMTKGGPLDSTRSVTYFTFDQFGFGNYGYAAAASYLLFLAVVLLTWLQFLWLGEREAKP